MNAGTVSRVLSLIPERTARTQSGVLFQLDAAGCGHPERLAHVSKFLSWLSPLESLTRDDQRVLGLIASNGRPMHATDDEDGEDAEVEVAELESEAQAWDRPEPLSPLPQPVL